MANVAREHHPSLERDTCVVSDSFIEKSSLHLGSALLRVLPYPFQRTVFGGSHGASSLTPLQWLALASQASKVRCKLSDGILLLPSVPLRH